MNNCLVIARNLDKVVSIDGKPIVSTKEYNAHVTNMFSVYDTIILDDTVYCHSKLPDNKQYIVITGKPVPVRKVHSHFYFMSLAQALQVLDSNVPTLILGSSMLGQLLVDTVDDLWLTTMKNRTKKEEASLPNVKFAYNPYTEFKKISVKPIKGGVIEHFIRR